MAADKSEVPLVLHPIQVKLTPVHLYVSESACVCPVLLITA